MATIVNAYKSVNHKQSETELYSTLPMLSPLLEIDSSRFVASHIHTKLYTCSRVSLISHPGGYVRFTYLWQVLIQNEISSTQRCLVLYFSERFAVFILQLHSHHNILRQTKISHRQTSKRSLNQTASSSL